MRKCGTTPIIAALFGLLFSATGFSQTAKANQDFKDITPTSAPLKIELFNLVDETGSAYSTADGKEVRQAFDELINTTGAKAAQLKERLLSGPEPQGMLWQAGASQQWLYSACQEHMCSTTNAVFLYEQSGKRMVGRLMVRCKVSWLGNPSDVDKALLDTASPIDLNDSNRKFDCAKG